MLSSLSAPLLLSPLCPAPAPFTCASLPFASSFCLSFTLRGFLADTGPSACRSFHYAGSVPCYKPFATCSLLRCNKTSAIALPYLHTDSTDTPPQAPSRLRLRPTQTSSIGRGRRSSKLLSRRFGSAREPGGACGIWCTLLVPWFDLSFFVVSVVS